MKTLLVVAMFIGSISHAQRNPLINEHLTYALEDTNKAKYKDSELFHMHLTAEKEKLLSFEITCEKSISDNLCANKREKIRNNIIPSFIEAKNLYTSDGEMVTFDSTMNRVTFVVRKDTSKTDDLKASFIPNNETWKAGTANYTTISINESEQDIIQKITESKTFITEVQDTQLEIDQLRKELWQTGTKIEFSTTDYTLGNDAELFLAFLKEVSEVKSTTQMDLTSIKLNLFDPSEIISPNLVDSKNKRSASFFVSGDIDKNKLKELVRTYLEKHIQDDLRTNSDPRRTILERNRVPQKKRTGIWKSKDR